MEEPEVLQLILTSQKDMQEKIVEIRVDIGIMKGDIKQLQAGQSDARLAIKEKAAINHTDKLITASGVKTSEEQNTLDHQKIWEAINKLTTWGRAVAIVGSILVGVLSIMTAVLTIVRF